MINSDYLFIFCKQNIVFFNFNKDFKKSNEKMIGLDILEHKIQNSKTHIIENPQIVGVYTGSDPNIIVIDIEMGQEQRTLYVWNIDSNAEMSYFDVQDGYDLVWDNDGLPYIITDGKCIFTYH